MLNDILVILMMAFGLFAVGMFILFYISLKKHYNNKHIDDDYRKDLDREDLMDNDSNIDEFIPKKKI